MPNAELAAGCEDARGTSVARVLIVDDHELLRDGWIELLANNPKLAVCGEAEEEAEAMRLVRATQPHPVIVDVAPKRGDGINLIKRIKAHDETILVVVCSMHDESLCAERTLLAGASGDVHKQSPAGTMLEAIDEVLAGNFFLSPRMTKRLVSDVTHAGGEPQTSPVEDLADRGLSVFTLIRQELMTGQIAGQLHLSPRTVKTYRERLKSKLGSRTAAELNRRAVQWVLQSDSNLNLPAFPTWSFLQRALARQFCAAAET